MGSFMSSSSSSSSDLSVDDTFGLLPNVITTEQLAAAFEAIEMAPDVVDAAPLPPGMVHEDGNDYAALGHGPHRKDVEDEEERALAAEDGDGDDELVFFPEYHPHVGHPPLGVHDASGWPFNVAAATIAADPAMMASPLGAWVLGELAPAPPPEDPVFLAGLIGAGPLPPPRLPDLPMWVPRGDVHSHSTAIMHEDFSDIARANFDRGFCGFFNACNEDDVKSAQHYLKRLVLPRSFDDLTLEYGFALRFAVWCSRRGSLKVVKWLLEHIDPLWARHHHSGCTVVMIAARIPDATVEHRAKLIRLLQDHGDDIMQMDDWVVCAGHLMVASGIPLLPPTLLVVTAHKLRESLQRHVLGRLGVVNPRFVPRCANLSALVARLVNGAIPLLGPLPEGLVDKIRRPPVSDREEDHVALFGPTTSDQPFSMNNDRLCDSVTHICRRWRNML